MARRCDMCGKGPSVGHNVSHANNRTKRRWYPNLQRVKTNLAGRITHIRACTQCIRSGRILKVA